MAQIEAQRLLRLVESQATLVTWDIEAMGLKGDYGSILCVSLKPFGKKPISYSVSKPGQDRDLVATVSEELKKYDVWMTYYGKGFDVPMLRTRLLKHQLPDLEPRLHVDMFFNLKFAILTARKSQGHLLSWLRLPEKKMTVSADDWARVASDPKGVMPIMIKRCESDTEGLEALYKRTKQIIREIKR